MTINNITLHNSLTRKKELFIPLNINKIGLYVCGPTVYDRPHLGNARSTVVYDILFRLLRHDYGEENIVYVRNITDVDDKINARAAELKIPINELTEITTSQFHDDMDQLNVLPPTIEPRATHHINDIIQMIEKLVTAEHAYIVEGHVLFSTQSFIDYGKLTGRRAENEEAGARIAIASYKRDPADFVLWKPAGSQEGWDSPFGFGRPGWHIECSAMSTKHLGVNFDIHGGGSDLQFPHHENEIAQSLCANPNSHFAAYWVHNGFLMVDGQKMSKSLGNFTTVHDLLNKGVNPLAIRIAMLSTHYRKPLNFSQKLLDDSSRLADEMQKIEACDFASIPQDLIDALRNDMNTPLALSVIHRLVKNKNSSELASGASLLGISYRV